MEKKKWNLPLLRAAIAANCLSFASGNAYSWASPVLPKLNGNVGAEHNPFTLPITPLQESLVVSLVSLGATVGPVAGGAVVDKFGRKRTLMLFSVPMVISYVIMAFATSIEYFYFARFLLGLGAGSVYSLVPMYIGEVAEDSNRGALGCIMNTMATLGSLFCFSVGPYITVKHLSLSCIAPVAIFLVVFGFWAPESPYFLILVDKKDQAAAALARLRSGKIEKELEEIAKNIRDSTKIKIKFGDLLKSKAVVKGLIIGSGLMVFQQFSGITIILAYMQTIFQFANSSIPADVSSIIVGFVQLLANLLTSQLVDRLGRKILITFSLVGAFIAHVSLGVYFHLQTTGCDVTSIFWLPIASVMLYIISFNIGIGPVTWAMMGELFPSNFKSFATTFTTVICCFFSFILMLFYPSLNATIGMAKSFWLFGFICGVGVIFVIWIVPETKGKSLQEIQIMLEEGRKK